MSTPDCNLFSGDVTLQSVCTVSTNDDVVVRWYYSMEEHQAGRNGSIVESDMRIRVNSHCRRSTLCLADLTIFNIEPSHEGYYWCEVDEESSGILTSFPNPVLRVNTCNTFRNDCMKNTTYHTNINTNSGRCALSTMSQARNLTFVDLQNCSSTTAATTIGNGRTSPLFLETAAMSSAMSTSLAVSTSMPLASTVGTESFSSPDEVEASTALSGDDGAALPLTLIVPIVGAGVGVMLCVVAILLALVLAVQCRRKTGKGDNTCVCVCVCACVRPVGKEGSYIGAHVSPPFINDSSLYLAYLDVLDLLTLPLYSALLSSLSSHPMVLTAIL